MVPTKSGKPRAVKVYRDPATGRFIPLPPRPKRAGGSGTKPRSGGVPTVTRMVPTTSGKPRAVRMYRDPSSGRMIPLPPRNVPTMIRMVPTTSGTPRAVTVYRDPATGRFIPLPPRAGPSGGARPAPGKSGAGGGVPTVIRMVPTSIGVPKAVRMYRAQGGQLVPLPPKNVPTVTMTVPATTPGGKPRVVKLYRAPGGQMLPLPPRAVRRPKNRPLIVEFAPSSAASDDRLPATVTKPTKKKAKSLTNTGWAQWARTQRNGTSTRPPLRIPTPRPSPGQQLNTRSRAPVKIPTPQAVAPTVTILPTASFNLGGSGGGGSSGASPVQEPTDQNRLSGGGASGGKDTGLSPTIIGVIVGVVVFVLILAIAVFAYLRKTDGKSDPYMRWNAWKEGSKGMELGSLPEHRRSSAGYVDSIYARQSADFTPYIAPSPGAKRTSFAPGSSMIRASVNAGPQRFTPAQRESISPSPPRRSITPGKSLQMGRK